MFEKIGNWNGWVSVLLGAAALMGGFNSIVQLAHICADAPRPIAGNDWSMIVLWLVLLVVWTLLLGLVFGVRIGRRFVEAGAREG